jgi:SAM-dependent methyltransferase
MKAFDSLAADQRMRQHYDAVWSADDPWSLRDSGYEQRRFARQLDLLCDRHYRSILEIGCGAGAFTRLLSPLAVRVVALDVSVAAIERAQQQNSDLENTSFVAENVMDFDMKQAGPWDLIVLSETIYCLGWLYPLFNVGWLLSQLLEALAPGGRLLLANTYGQDRDYLLRPWLIDTYRDLVSHVGFQLEHEEVFEDVKDGTSFQVLMSRYIRPSSAVPLTNQSTIHLASKDASTDPC